MDYTWSLCLFMVIENKTRTTGNLGGCEIIVAELLLHVSCSEVAVSKILTPWTLNSAPLNYCCAWPLALGCLHFLFYTAMPCINLDALSWKRETSLKEKDGPHVTRCKTGAIIIHPLQHPWDVKETHEHITRWWLPGSFHLRRAAQGRPSGSVG